MRVADKTSDELWVCHPGTVPYLEAIALQERIRERRQAEELPDTLLLLEHPPVYTRGRRSDAEDLSLGEDFYRAKGIDVVDTDRGGRVTFHGPGQLVGYPIMRIHDIGAHLRIMEAAIINALAEEGIAARSRHEEGIDYTGVWVEDRKIASIGVHVSRGISTHGFAVNVDNDLDPFSWVVACGLPDVEMTSISREQSRSAAGHPRQGHPLARPGGARDGRVTGEAVSPSSEPDLRRFRRRMADHFCQAHDRRLRPVSPQRLGIDTAHAARLAATRAPLNPNPPAEAIPV
jgi:lipoyl(octanoyl) transferase